MAMKCDTAMASFKERVTGFLRYERTVEESPIFGSSLQDSWNVRSIVPVSSRRLRPGLPSHGMYLQSADVPITRFDEGRWTLAHTIALIQGLVPGSKKWGCGASCLRDIRLNPSLLCAAAVAKHEEYEAELYTFKSDSLYEG